MWQRLISDLAIFALGAVAISSAAIAPQSSPTPASTQSPTPEPQPSPTPTLQPSPTPEPQPSPTPTLQPSPTPEPQPSPTPASTQSPTPEPQPSPTPTPQPSPTPVQPPIPGEACEAETTINGDRILYRTSYINDDNLKAGGQPVEVDMLKNDSFAAHALTHYAGNFTLSGATATGTPILLQLNPEKNQIKITHAGRTVSGKCGEILSEISFQNLF